jgi:hypothetical protein
MIERNQKEADMLNEWWAAMHSDSFIAGILLFMCTTKPMLDSIFRIYRTSGKQPEHGKKP